jgi:hypothetical protein
MTYFFNGVTRHQNGRLTMTWIITLNLAALLGVAVVALTHTNTNVREKVGPPPRVYTNLPHIEQVDIQAFLKKWAD